MEINRFDRVLGVIPTADVVEGRFVILCAHTHDYDFGSKADLPGARIPATAEEANNARFLITWAVDNRKPPYYQPMPAFSWALRAGGWDQTANVPFNAAVWMTYPGYQNQKTIPSGTPSLAYGEGTYTLYSGDYIYNANLIVPGALVQAANTAEDGDDAGKAKLLDAYSTRMVATVEHYDSTDYSLTIRLDH